MKDKSVAVLFAICGMPVVMICVMLSRLHIFGDESGDTTAPDFWHGATEGLVIGMYIAVGLILILRKARRRRSRG